MMPYIFESKGYVVTNGKAHDALVELPMLRAIECEAFMNALTCMHALMITAMLNALKRNAFTLWLLVAVGLVSCFPACGCGACLP